MALNRWERLDSTTLGNGDELTLDRRADEYALRVAGVELMNSRQHGSEEELARLALARLTAGAGDRGLEVLVGGLGMGFTLRATLDLLSQNSRVSVAELVPEVVDWNRTYLAPLAGEPLSDPRVRVVVGDVAKLLQRTTAGFDVVLLDTDNGPEGTTQDENEWLYGADGLSTARAALRPGGVLAVWSMFPSEAFTKRLSRAGFDVEVKQVRSRGKKGNRHVIWTARRSDKTTARKVAARGSKRR